MTHLVDWRVIEEASGHTFRWGYAGEDLVAEWGGVLQLRASRRGELKAVYPVPGAPDDLVQKTRFGVAAAFLRAQRHEYALHASAIACRGKALVCVGASGMGKSTMAERMCRNPDVDLLADDMAGVDVSPSGGVQVPPSEANVWLATQSSLPKTPVKPSRTAKHPSPLACIASLLFDETARALEVRDIRGADAVSALLPSLVRFERNHALWAREIDFIEQLVSQSRVVAVRRSHDVGADAVADALRTLLIGEADE